MQRALAERRVHLRNLCTALWLPHALVAVMEHMLAIEHTFRLQAESRDMLVPRQAVHCTAYRYGHGDV